MTNSICTPKPHLSITIKSHSLHLVSPSHLQKLNPFILFLVLSLSHTVSHVHITLQSNLFSLSHMFFIKYMDTWRVHTLMHSRSGYLSPGCKGQLLVGGSLGTVDKGERNDSREKGDERGPSACPAAVQQQPDGTREKSWASQNPAQCLTHQECACTCP